MLLLSWPAQAQYGLSVVQGAKDALTGNWLVYEQLHPMAPPGQPFGIDFTAVNPAVATPLDIMSCCLLMEAGGMTVNSYKIILDADPAVTFSFQPQYQTQLSLLLYNPTYGVPGGNTPKQEMDPLWGQEMMDGVISGKLWVDGNWWGGLSYVHMSSSGTFLVPEPATLALLLAGGCLGLRRRR